MPQPTHTPTFQGAATLLDANGDLVAEVAAELWKISEPGRGEQWGGLLAAAAGTDRHLPTAEESYTLRLDSGLEGRVTAHGAVVITQGAISCQETVQILGAGEPPF